MSTKRTVVCGLFIAAIVVTACSDNTPSEPVEKTPPQVVEAVISPTRHPLVQSLAITLADSAAVEVAYRDSTGEVLHVSADSAAIHHNVMLSRLRAGATYTYAVRSRTAKGVLGDSATGSFQTAALPAQVAQLAFAATGTPTLPVTLVQVSTSSNGWLGMLAVNASGKVVWYHKTKTGVMGFLRRPDHTIAIIDQGIVVIGPLGDTVASLPQTAGVPYGNIHHAMTNSPTGNILFTATDTRTINDTSVVGDAIWEWNPATGSTVKRWTAFDFFDWQTERTVSSGPSDWLHANALAIGTHGNIILSMRNMDQVVSIAPDYKRVEWRLGGPGATITLPLADRFYGQHGAKEISPGRLLLFDNGFDRPTGLFSRAMEIAVNASAHTATKVWEYRASPDIFATRLGSVHRFSNGNTLIDFGWLMPDPIQILEVSSNGEIVWKLAPANTVPGKIYAVEPLNTLFGETN